MTTLETQRLVIRNFRAGDWAALHEMIVQYAASGVAAYDHAWPTSPEEIRKITTWFAAADGYFAVCLKDTGRFIGFVSLTPGREGERREFGIGYIFNFDYHGQGYATEACRAVIDHAFEHLGAHRVSTGTAAANRASCRLLERLGFKRIAQNMGSLRNTEDGSPITFLGYTYAISRDEWEGAEGNAVIGIDQSQGMLAGARAQFPGVRYEKIGLQEMAYASAFDGAICMDAMEHVGPEDWPLVLGNFNRALKPGGHLYFTVEIADAAEVAQAFERARAAGLPAVYGEWPDEVVYHYYPAADQVRTWLREAGFEPVEEGKGDLYWHLIVRKATGVAY